MSLIQNIHHVAYRCKDAKETVDWYTRHLGMKFVLAIAENEVPSTKAPDPYTSSWTQAMATYWRFLSCPRKSPWAVTKTPRPGCSIWR
jgi:catechol 2,3-dioxygenase-like lactoylglutathione lyase family enzyme